MRLLVFGGAAFLVEGHAPYRQWIAYRADRLMIVANRRPPEAFPLAKTLATHLRRTIPDARAEVARSPTLLRIAQLVITKQIEVAVVTTAEAQQMARGEGAIAREGPVPLRVLAFLREPYVLVCHSEFDRERAYLMVFGLFDEEGSPALDRTAGSLSSAMRRASEIQVPLHVGAREFYLELGKGAQDS